jgi:hypothetical protein
MESVDLCLREVVAVVEVVVDVPANGGVLLATGGAARLDDGGTARLNEGGGAERDPTPTIL